MNSFLNARLLAFAIVQCVAAASGFADESHRHASLPNFDRRTTVTNETQKVSSPSLLARQAKHDQLRSRLPEVMVETDAITGSPKSVSSRRGFLSGASGNGRAIPSQALEAISAADTNRAVKAFLNEYRGLFGHGAEVLDGAKVDRDYVDAHNGMRTTLWQQQVDGLDVFEAVLKSHLTKKGELINVGSQFVADPAAAATKGVSNRAAIMATPPISAAQAVANAGQNLGEQVSVAEVSPVEAATEGSQRKQKFNAPGLHEATARLVWLPMDGATLRLCWDVLLVSKSRGEMFTVLVDAQTGEVVVRICRTAYATPATYRVFTSDSPTPMSPGWSTPNTNQPAEVARSLVTLTSLSAIASPDGWINDGVSNTIGNNVDAHLDWNNDNIPDPGSRPFGTNRVFDFPMDLTQAPTNYANAAVVQLFYWCNFMHDKLYDLGFTEAAGNFQTTNFARGGLGNDAVQANAQDSGGLAPILGGDFQNRNNANFGTPPDGSPPRMQMYIWSGPTPNRDGDLDAHIILHEYAHGLSTRLVGGGVGISAQQTGGMGEGWADFYALALLTDPGANLSANYPLVPYSTFQSGSPLAVTNYYFGIRRYPYSTDLTKNPLTFKDIDPTKAISHAGVPIKGIFVATNANQSHNAGEVWCVTLWEARANLITKHGIAGNQLVLQLVTDGMKLSPANPNFLQARDAILLADQVNNNGANLLELWQAFSKRGMGNSATSSVATTNTVVEAFDLPPFIALALAVDAPTLTWESGGNANWFSQTATNHDGVDAAQSGAINSSQQTYMETTVQGPGTLSFWWKVSSELGYDFLRFTLDGNISNSISGTVDWQLVSVAVPAGSHALRWTYSKDVSLAVGADAGWVDQIGFSPTLPVALDTTNLTWSTAGNANWAGQITTTHDSEDAAQSGDIADSQTSYLETTVSGPGAVSFWWRVSSEANYDFLRFYLDGVEQASALGISGEVNWQQKSVVIPAGNHTLRWTYSKDFSISSGADAGWLDQMVFASSVVVNTNDSGPGSLRQIIADLPADNTVTFATNLSGTTITLTNGQLLLNKSLSIDASSLPGGITISGNNASRAFRIIGGKTVTLNSLTITDCVSADAFLGGYGGAIMLEGRLNLTDCTLRNNSAAIGGAILVRFNSSGTIMDNCTFSQNSASRTGGAIEAEGPLTINNSTFWGNNGTTNGGAIRSTSPSLALNFCTVSGNSAAAGSGIHVGTNAALTTLSGNIIAGNAGAGANIAGNFTATGVNLTNGNPLLAPLGNYGGRTQTLLPLPGSPAIDAGVSTSLITDQRGFSRVVGTAVDIGAVETSDHIPGYAAVVTVNTDTFDGLDNNGVSLREAVVLSTNITFANGLSGQTIVLTNGQLALNKTVRIDGASLTNGVAISGNAATRVFEVVSGMTTLNSLTITNGNAQFANGLGGGILVRSNATLVANNCAILGNVANFGGGILGSYSTLTLNNSTIFGNTSASLAGLGGGIYNFEGTLAVTNCTVAGNSANLTAGTGAGIYTTATTTMANTIVCSNNAANFPNVFAGVGFTGTNNLIDANGLLLPLGFYGGYTRTMPPLPGSPAIDAGGATTLTTDQRGLPRVAGAATDIGAVELQTPNLIVTSTADSGVGSLREVIGLVDVSSTITFAPGLSGSTILLTGGQIVLNDNVIIDGSSLAAGIRLNGNAASRIFFVSSGMNATLTGLILTNGLASQGGAIQNLGNLTLNQCTLASNHDNCGCGINGGAVLNRSSLVANNSTFSGNTARFGGAIYNDLSSTLTINQSTFTGNVGTNGGGAIYNFNGTMTVNQSTVVGNQSPGGGAQGGGINNSGFGFFLTNSIVCSNTASSNPNIAGVVTPFSSPNNLVDANAFLSPLGNYGGTMLTMRPQIGSPVIDNGNDAAASGLSLDQRGRVRTSGIRVDIGAVELNTNTVVTTVADSGGGSLRSVVANAESGYTITFAPGLSGQTIQLTSGQITLSQNQTVDGSSLASSVQINGNAASRIFFVNSGVSATLNGLILTNGLASQGGAIQNLGSLTLNQCTLAGNHDNCGCGINGGAVLNRSSLVANNSTFSGNTARFGGAIYNDLSSTLTVNQSTFTGNVGTNAGGAIYNFNGTMTVNQSTVVGNQSPGGGAQGGGINNSGFGLFLTNSIVCSNTASSNPNIAGVVTPFSSPNNLVDANALLSPLGNYGGATLTMPPLAGSPVLNAGNNAQAASFITDQRGTGFPRVVGAQVDIGAVELQLIVATNPPVLTGLTKLGNGTFQFSFTNLTGASFTILASTNVALPIIGWSNLGTALETPASSGQFQFTDPQATNHPQRFYRVKSP